MGNAFISFDGELSRPATVLIEKISEAVGGLYRPHQIRRVAKAKADAAMIKATTEIAIGDLKRRAMKRLVVEETRKQQNMESIVEKAIEGVAGTASPEKMDDDWIVHFFDKCRLVSQQEMQLLWASILAREANSPGSFSKRTIDSVATLDRDDAEAFARLMCFGFVVDEDIIPLVYDINEAIYAAHGVDFTSMTHLDNIGLIKFDNAMSYEITRLPGRLSLSYHGRGVILDLGKDQDSTMIVGPVLCTKVGGELAHVCPSEPIEGFLDYAKAKWMSLGYRLLEG